MESNDEAAIIEKHKKRRRAQLIAIIPVVAALLATIPAGDDGYLGLSRNVIGAGSLLVILGVVVFSYFNWRCCACNSYLGRGINPRFCHRCGVRLM